MQGIGFRPFIYRLAEEYSLTGVVYNNTAGVSIEVQGQNDRLNEFLAQLSSDNPKIPLMKILGTEINDIEIIESEKTFTIAQSSGEGNISAAVTADIAICRRCLFELYDPSDFRCQYPFINCTNCGPRYSIIKNVPYDRPNTTMAHFTMCTKCRRQYEQVSDRRFHAQPVACPVCGPSVYLCAPSGETTEADTQKAIEKTTQMLLEGKVVAIKGLGGFHLAVDAENDSAVKTLRNRKRRDRKPFAMMAVSVEQVKKFAVVDEASEKILISPQAPIVLLPKRNANTIAALVAEDVNTFGFMLAYTPLHHLLLGREVNGRKLSAIVATSGNISDEPLICENDEAVLNLGDIADAFLMHNRQIRRQVDDSVVHIIDNQQAILRRARGFVPVAIVAAGKINSEIFAAGADMKNTFCLARENQFILSEHIGNLAEGRVYKHWLKSIEHFLRLFDVRPETAACDLHPGYLSSRYARRIRNVKIVEVQHHWAHAASVMAEHGIKNQKIISLIADGTGFGTDGAIWGCECLIASLTGFSRFGHLDYFPLPGADKAAKQAIRPLLGLAFKYNLKLSEKLLSEIEPNKTAAETIKTQLKKNINTVATSSMGRLFDAAGALCGMGGSNDFEAQLPMRLESIAEEDVKNFYPFSLKKDKENVVVNIKHMLEGIISDVEKGVSAGTVSAKFHNTAAEFLCEMAIRAREQTGINTAVISGGVFCNRFLANRLIQLLRQKDFRVLFNRLVPANDGGISLGQAAIAAATR